MASYFPSTNISEAWHSVARFLLLQRGYRSHNVVVAVENPLGEVAGVRTLVDRLVPSDGVSTNIDRVADTVFPSDFYAAGEERAMEMLLERRRAAREFEKESVPKGNYFDIICDYPYGSKPFNQLQHVVDRLRASKRNNKQNSNQCEMGISVVGEIPDLRVQTPGIHKSIMGFPCLSHISVTLGNGAVHLAATYRAQDFVHKGYGNLVGLGRLADFLSQESGYRLGEVVCVATGAILERPPQGWDVMRAVVNEVGEILQKEKSI